MRKRAPRMADIVLHAEANFDIEAIYRFSEGRFGAAVADDYHDGLLDAVLKLESFPELGREIAGIAPPVRALSFRSHAIYYRFDGTTVTVVRILHHAMNAAALLEG